MNQLLSRAILQYMPVQHTDTILVSGGIGKLRPCAAEMGLHQSDPLSVLVEFKWAKEMEHWPFGGGEWVY